MVIHPNQSCLMGVNVCQESPSVSSADVFNLITDCLQHLYYADALTLAELCYEKTKSDESLIYICECLQRLDRLDELYSFLSPLSLNNPRIRYIFAKCCYDLNKLDESMRTLMAPCETSPTSSAKIGCKKERKLAALHPILAESSSAPFANLLLSQILSKNGIEEDSRHLAGKSLEGCPILWTGICQYLKMGGTDIMDLIDPQSKSQQIENNSAPRIEDFVKEDMEVDEVIENAGIDPSITPRVSYLKMTANAPRKGRQNESIELRRSKRSLTNQYIIDTENAGSRRGVKALGNNTANRAMNRLSNNQNRIATSRSPSNRKIETKQPLTSRNANRSASSTSINSGFTPTKLKKSEEREKEPIVAKRSGTKESSPLYTSIFSCIKMLASVEQVLTKYDWGKALQMIDSYSLEMQRHSMCSLQKARVVFEKCDYASAREVLQEIRCSFPYRLDGVDLLSTTLWHLQRNYELSTLAQELTSKHRDRAESWCVAGNCFSLQKHHQQAVECLRRAIRINPHYGYAYTLLGHELIEVDDVDSAKQAFRRALAINPNDYRSWYGLGMANHRNDLHALAERDLKRAWTLNPKNVPLLCQLAIVEKSLNKNREAKYYLEEALKLEPSRTVSKFHLAKLQYEMGEFEACVQNLEELKASSPDEAQIFFLLGKAYRRQGNTHHALLNFNWAAEMDPRGEQTMNYMNEQPYDEDG